MLSPTTPLYSADQTRQEPCWQAESIPVLTFTALLIIITYMSTALLWKLCYGGMVSMLLHFTSKGKKNKAQHEPRAAKQKPISLCAPSCAP